MDVTRITVKDSAYPSAAQRAFAEGSPPPIAVLGNLDLLQSKPLGLFCSVKCPGDVILRTYDLVRALRDAGIAVVGGFHSPMEKECLSLLLRGSQPVLVCPARGIEGMRLPAAWKQPLAEGRLLILSPFAREHRRVTADTSHSRNLLVAALADQVLVAHAGPGSKTEQLCRQVMNGGKPLWTLESIDNEHLLAAGARPLKPEDLSRLIRRA